VALLGADFFGNIETRYYRNAGGFWAVEGEDYSCGGEVGGDVGMFLV